MGLRILAKDRDYAESRKVAARSFEETRRFDRASLARCDRFESLHYHPSALSDSQQNSLFSLCIETFLFFSFSIFNPEFRFLWLLIVLPKTNPSFPSLPSVFLLPLLPIFIPLLLLLLYPLLLSIPSPTHLLHLLHLLPLLPLVLFSLFVQLDPFPDPTRNIRLDSKLFSPRSRSK